MGYLDYPVVMLHGSRMLARLHIDFRDNVVVGSREDYSFDYNLLSNSGWTSAVYFDVSIAWLGTQSLLASWNCLFSTKILNFQDTIIEGMTIDVSMENDPPQRPLWVDAITISLPPQKENMNESAVSGSGGSIVPSWWADLSRTLKPSSSAITEADEAAVPSEVLPDWLTFRRAAFDPSPETFVSVASEEEGEQSVAASSGTKDALASRRVRYAPWLLMNTAHGGPHQWLNFGRVTDSYELYIRNLLLRVNGVHVDPKAPPLGSATFADWITFVRVHIVDVTVIVTNCSFSTNVSTPRVPSSHYV